MNNETQRNLGTRQNELINNFTTIEIYYSNFVKQFLENFFSYSVFVIMII